MQNLKTKQTTLSVFKLVMMAVIAIDSLKNLPSNAQYGFYLIPYYLFAIFSFFLPSALVCAELAASLPQSGGAYGWVREAFGKKFAFVTGWMQWLIAITWAPTMLTFVIQTLLFSYDPALIENKYILFLAMLCIAWLTLFLISRGIESSSRISVWSATIGVILPMLFISILGIVWIITGKHLQIQLPQGISFQLANFNLENLRLFVPLIYSLMGMEMISIHAAHVDNPQKKYPLALFLAAFIIFCTVIPASLAIALVIPTKEINLTTGVVTTMRNFLIAFHLSPMLPLMIMSITIGSYGIFYSWLLTVTRYLLCAAEDNALPQFLKQTNSAKMPNRLLILQGGIFSVLAMAFIFMPSINSAYWLLTASCAQFALIYYIILFAAAIYLRFKRPDLQRPFRVGKTPLLITVLGVFAILTCLAAIIFGFIPPGEIIIQHQIAFYEITLSFVMLIGLGIGLLIYYLSQKMNQNPIPVYLAKESLPIYEAP